ncbi:hypothetical protein I4U23_014799 [Adineta vaga]|nr:hypothetical protein I4U23_014799 [Adineta vaga]
MGFDIIDGAAWERVLHNITTFKFSFSFHKSTWTQESVELESFSTPFWLEEKRWYVTYDRCTVSGFSLLYSTPYFKNIYSWTYVKGPIMTKSTKPQVLSYSNINYLYVNLKFPINTEILRRFTNIQTLNIRYIDRYFSILIRDIVPYLDLSKITMFFIQPCCFTLDLNVLVRLLSKLFGKLNQSVQTLSRLIDVSFLVLISSEREKLTWLQLIKTENVDFNNPIFEQFIYRLELYLNRTITDNNEKREYVQTLFLLQLPSIISSSLFDQLKTK